MLVPLLAVLAGAVLVHAQAPRRPHIVVILADDLGWNDVSFHGSDQIPTPNIDALAYNGIVLNNYYTQPMCTPSRAALLTGLHPVHTGMQHGVILEPEPWGLPLDVPVLPQYLRGLGYRAHAVGKWHLGYFRANYTPTARGFHSHYGLWNGYHDYYTHHAQASFIDMDGFDMRRGMEVDWASRGRYSTDLFTEEAERIVRSHPVGDGAPPLFLYLAHLAPHSGNYEAPLQAPVETIKALAHIKDPERRVYAAMVSRLDDSVGRVVQALQEKGMLSNSVIVFASDNGAITSGIHPNKGSNWPLKGVKGGPWDGAVRVPACVWSPLLRRPRRTSQQLMHVTDWLPTLLAAAGAAPAPDRVLDGVNLWESLSLGRAEGTSSPRQEVLVNIDYRGSGAGGYAALRLGDYKYVNGTALLGYQDTWLGESGREEPAPGVAAVPRALSSPTARAIAAAGLGLADPDRCDAVRRSATLRCEQGADKDGFRYPACRPLVAPCVFDLSADPCERRNLYGTPFLPASVLAALEQRLADLRQTVVPPRNVATDLRADPELWNGTWANWADLLDEASLRGAGELPRPRLRPSRWG
ncbi:arylsulfatase B-like [Frankliniella occidentalis]|uniref:Arylsulfatase B-like n=1 Tax=Frankliniella occidentalis TaxID=133901 RepID=A0A6J1T4A8_FRAOC|nr:arylsulfatase B-like [Frankliniella occidentalis]